MILLGYAIMELQKSPKETTVEGQATYNILIGHIPQVLQLRFNLVGVSGASTQWHATLGPYLQPNYKDRIFQVGSLLQKS